MGKREEIGERIKAGKTVLGIELGSTRIKAVLIDEDKSPIASGSYDWENQYVDHIWTYDMDEVWKGLQGCYRDLVKDVQGKYGVRLTSLAAAGISAMMHGYLAFDDKGELLVPFRTWRNTITGEASEKLSGLFSYHIPQRWSIAHLYQAVLNGEEHVKDVRFITTLSGYIHWKLTGQKVLGSGDAAGMFPMNIADKDYDSVMLEQFDALVADYGFPWKIRGAAPQSTGRGTGTRAVSPKRGRSSWIRQGALCRASRCARRKGDAGTGNDSDKQCGGKDGECLRRDERVCHGSPGKRSLKAV